MKLSVKRPIDWLAPLATFLAILACYGTLLILGMLAMMGIGIVVHEGLWAGAIVLFALLALAGIVLGWLRHRALPPLLLGLAGAGLVLWAMGVSYSRPVEITGFVFLILGAVLDWRAKRGNRTSDGHS